MNQNLNDMLIVLNLGQVFGKLKLIKVNNEEWYLFEEKCIKMKYRSVKCLEEE